MASRITPEDQSTNLSSRILRNVKASVDAQEFPWLLPWYHVRNERERAVRVMRSAALRLIRKQQGESTLAILWRALAWPALLPIKVWQYAKNSDLSDLRQCFIQGCLDLAQYNIRPGTLDAIRSQRPQETHLKRLYITDRENQAILVHLNQDAPNSNLGNKIVFENFCKHHALPHVPILVHSNSAPHTEPTSWPAADLFAKSPNLWGGNGAKILRHIRTTNKWQDQSNDTIDDSGIITWATEVYNNQPWLIQPMLRVDPLWGAWSPGPLGTVRIVTAVVQPNSAPEIVAASMRLPRSDMIVDNFSEGGLSAEIDWRTGLLGPALGHEGRHPWHDYHPDTQGRIMGAKVPQWSKLCELACAAHTAALDLAAVGWDISCHKGEPILIEANPVFNIAPTVILGETRWLDAILNRRAEL